MIVSLTGAPCRFLSLGSEEVVVRLDWPAIFTALVAAVIAGLGAMIPDWWKRRNREGRSRGAIADATSYVEFVDRWHQAQQRTGTESARREGGEWAANELERTRSLLLARLEADSPQPEDEPNLIRSWLLFYRLHTLRAKASRALFLIILFLDFVAIFGTFGEPQPNIVGMILGSIILISIGLGFRTLALHLEKKGKSRLIPTSGGTVWTQTSAVRNHGD